MTDSMTGCPELLEKAGAPMATEEFERILRTEREYWSTCYLDEVRALEKTVSAVQQQAASDRIEAEALRASVRDLRAEGESSWRTARLAVRSGSTLGAAKLALLEDTVSELREAIQAERGHVHTMVVALQSDVARLQAAFAGQQDEAPMRRLGRLSEDLEQTPVIQSLQAEVHRLAESAKEQEKICQSAADFADLHCARPPIEDGSTSAGLDLRMQDEAIAELRAEVAHLRASFLEQARPEELARVGSLQRLVQDQRRELSVLSSELGTLCERHTSDTDRSQQVLGVIQAFMDEEQRRRAEVSGTAGTAAVSEQQQQWRAVSERVAEIESRMAAAARQQEEAPLEAPVAEKALPTLLTSGGGAAERDGVEPDGAKPDGAIVDAEAARVAVQKVLQEDSLRAVMTAVQKALQEEGAQAPGPAGVLQGIMTAPAGLLQGAPVAAPQPASQPTSQPAAAVQAPPPAWRPQRPQGLAATAAAPPLQAPGPLLAVGQRGHRASIQLAPGTPVGQRGHGASIQLAPGTPLLVRRC